MMVHFSNVNAEESSSSITVSKIQTLGAGTNSCACKSLTVSGSPGYPDQGVARAHSPLLTRALASTSDSIFSCIGFVTVKLSIAKAEQLSVI